MSLLSCPFWRMPGFSALFGALLLPRQFPECFALFLQKQRIGPDLFAQPQFAAQCLDLFPRLRGRFALPAPFLFAQGT